MGSHGVRQNWSDLACMRALEKEMATHSSIFAWRIPGTEEPSGLPSMGSYRVGHNWSDLAAAAAFWMSRRKAAPSERKLPLSPSSSVLIGLWRDDCGVDRSREGPRSQPSPRPIQKHISHSSPGGDGDWFLLWLMCWDSEPWLQRA